MGDNFAIDKRNKAFQSLEASKQDNNQELFLPSLSNSRHFHLNDPHSSTFSKHSKQNSSTSTGKEMERGNSYFRNNNSSSVPSLHSHR